MADSSPRPVLDLILTHGDMTPTELAAELPFTRQAVAKHLAVRDRAGLVESRRSGTPVPNRTFVTACRENDVSAVTTRLTHSNPPYRRSQFRSGLRRLISELRSGSAPKPGTQIRRETNA